VRRAQLEALRESTRLRIWGSGVRISSGVPTGSVFKRDGCLLEIAKGQPRDIAYDIGYRNNYDFRRGNKLAPGCEAAIAQFGDALETAKETITVPDRPDGADLAATRLGRYRGGSRAAR
jgi:hypothetical protein